MARLVRNTNPVDEFDYEAHEIICDCGVRSSRRISHDAPTVGRKYFGCGNAMKGCGYFVWFEDKVAVIDEKVALVRALNDKIELASVVDLLVSQNRGLSDENRDLQSTLTQVMTTSQVHDEGNSSNSYNFVLEDQIRDLSQRVAMVEQFMESLE
ncbi:hypothetical protein LINPERPRIM_LOCUS22003 [Linum perenne]